jgi:predicted Zn-dependent protease with MMP-like domain
MQMAKSQHNTGSKPNQDEFTYYRQPTLDRDYEQMGEFQPLARRSYNSDTAFRGIGALNAITGQVTYQQSWKVGIKQLTQFYDSIVADYPRAITIYMVQMPTYASWANPIEKLWKWVRQTVIHLHRLSDDWSILKERVLDFILSFRRGSNELLRYVGLLPD